MIIELERFMSPTSNLRHTIIEVSRFKRSDDRCEYCSLAVQTIPFLFANIVFNIKTKHYRNFLVELIDLFF